jgi:hypothetical protein
MYVEVPPEVAAVCGWALVFVHLEHDMRNGRPELRLPGTTWSRAGLPGPAHDLGGGQQGCDQDLGASFPAAAVLEGEVAEGGCWVAQAGSLVHVDNLADLFCAGCRKALAGELFRTATQTGSARRTSPPRSAMVWGLGAETVALERADLAGALGAPPLAEYRSINSQTFGEKPPRVLGWNPRRLSAPAELARLST